LLLLLMLSGKAGDLAPAERQGDCDGRLQIPSERLMLQFGLEADAIAD
jgi:hypothetical protein